jgi:multidrug efflux pump subunit AcrA (membrane-fusion protein)
MFARASLEANGEGGEVLVVPEAAIYQVGDRKVAFVAEQGGRFAVRDVEVGRNEGGGFEVISGLNEGDQVVTQGGVRLKAMLLNGAGSRKQ